MILLALHEVLNELSAIPEIYAPDFIGHFPAASPFGELRGHSGVRGAIESVRRAFPDWTETIEDIVIEGDQVVTRYEGTGVHKEAFFSMPPTGKLVRTEEISIFRVQNGLVVEQWCLIDRRARIQGHGWAG